MVTRIVTIGSSFEETPEGLYRMDRWRRIGDYIRARMTEEERKIEDEIAAAEDRIFVWGMTRER